MPTPNEQPTPPGEQPQASGAEPSARTREPAPGAPASSGVAGETTSGEPVDEAATSESHGPLQVSEDIIAAVVCFGIAGLFFSRTGVSGGRLDWIYPRGLLAFIAGVGVVLLIRGLRGRGTKRSLVPPVLRGTGSAVAVFALIVFGFAILLEPVGFWPMAVAMVFVTSMVLTPERTRRVALVSLAVALVVAVVGHLVFREVFFIPFPDPPWWPT